MKGDAKVVEFLNKALRHELTAVNQYWLHYRLLDNWGYKDLAKQWRKESIEEMEHADKLVVRIISSKVSRTCNCSIPCASVRTSKRCLTATWRRRFPPARSTRKPRRTATPRRTM
jgi:rubrerythrin